MSANQSGKAQEAKERLAAAGMEAKKRFANTKLGQKVEETVSKVETKLPDLKNTLQAKAEERIQQITQSATEAGDLAKSVAKAQVDQVLLNLKHKGLDLSESNELVHRIGQSVLRRADEVREMLEGHHMAPAWLKDLKLGDKLGGISQKFTESMGTKTEAAESTSVADATVAQASADVQPDTLHAVGKDTVESEGGHSEQAPELNTTDSELLAAETLSKATKPTRAKTGKRTRAATEH